MDIVEVKDDANQAHRSKLKKKGIIIINENFTSEMMERVYFDIFELEMNNNIRQITLYINSNGGQVVALFPIIDLMENCSTPISTVVMGKAYSCGALLSLCGDKGYRFAHKHSHILLHEVSSASYGKNSQVQEDARDLKRINQIFKRLLRERTKMKSKDIERYMNSNTDIFISAQQALRYGLIDKII